MSKIKIMCTSTGCIDYAPERYKALNIEIIRIHVFFEGKEYREGLDLNPDEFYKRLETIEDPKNNLPTTAMPDTEEIRAALSEQTVRAFAALRLSGYSRFDYIVDKNDDPWCLEANTLPGMTPTSLLPQMAQATGMSYGALCSKIVELALKK